jgi:hypothetical protein
MLLVQDLVYANDMALVSDSMDVLAVHKNGKPLNLRN